MIEALNHSKVTVKVYHGYGHKDNLIVYGHVLAGKYVFNSELNTSVLSNIIQMIKLFFVKPLPNRNVTLDWGDQHFKSLTGEDGFFKFEWQSATSIAAGWHPIKINVLTPEGHVEAHGIGKLFVPHITQYGFISDIDDTVLVSHSGTTGKKIRALFTLNPRSRKTFADVVKYYNLLAFAHTNLTVPNPFFYVSSSEWNLYDYLNEFFKYNKLPKGIFLLNGLKRWYQLLKTGKTKHEGKMVRAVRILETFPKQRFVLLGDNSQSDPAIYVSIANTYSERIVAIYLRNISPEKELKTIELMASIQNKNIYTCLFKHTDEAIEHSKKIGLIEG